MFTQTHARPATRELWAGFRAARVRALRCCLCAGVGASICRAPHRAMSQSRTKSCRLDDSTDKLEENAQTMHEDIMRQCAERAVYEPARARTRTWTRKGGRSSCGARAQVREGTLSWTCPPGRGLIWACVCAPLCAAPSTPLPALP